MTGSPIKRFAALAAIQSVLVIAVIGAVVWFNSGAADAVEEDGQVEFLRLTEGADFGWPYCYYDPERRIVVPLDWNSAIAWSVASLRAGLAGPPPRFIAIPATPSTAACHTVHTMTPAPRTASA
mgnify:CR=1 FL=1